jgi:hypothetical protein
MEEKVGGTEKEKLESALGRVPSPFKGSSSLYATVTGRLAGISSCAYKTSGWAFLQVHLNGTKLNGV